MTYLLDTNTCIRFPNGTSEPVRRRFETSRSREISVCSMVKAELFFGAYKSAQPERNLSRIDRFLGAFPSLPFDDNAAQEYGRIRSDLEKLGTPIGPNDLCIAAIALANELILVTHNTGEFERVDGLQLADWED